MAENVDPKAQMERIRQLQKERKYQLQDEILQLKALERERDEKGESCPQRCQPSKEP